MYLIFVSIKNQRIWSSTSICFTQFLESATHVMFLCNISETQHVNFPVKPLGNVTVIFSHINSMSWDACCHRSQLFKLCPESHIFLCCHLHCYLARQAKTKSIEIDYIQASYSCQKMDAIFQLPQICCLVSVQSHCHGFFVA